MQHFVAAPVKQISWVFQRYCNDPKFLDRYAWANSADPDQTAPLQTMQTQIRLLLEEQSDQGLHCLPFRLHRLDSLLYDRGERGGSVVECRTPEREVRGSRPTSAVLCP